MSRNLRQRPCGVIVIAAPAAAGERTGEVLRVEPVDGEPVDHVVAREPFVLARGVPLVEVARGRRLVAPDERGVARPGRAEHADDLAEGLGIGVRMIPVPPPVELAADAHDHRLAELPNDADQVLDSASNRAVEATSWSMPKRVGRERRSSLAKP